MWRFLLQLHGTVKVRIERIEVIPDKMVGAAWVSRVTPAGWVLNRDPHTIKVEELYRMFVFRRGFRHAEQTPELEALVHEISVRIAEHMQISVDELFRSAGRADTLAAKPPVCGKRAGAPRPGRDHSANAVSAGRADTLAAKPQPAAEQMPAVESDQAEGKSVGNGKGGRQEAQLRPSA